MREERVEQPGRVRRVGAGVESLLERREDPDGGPAVEPLDEVLDPALELADVHRVCVDLRGAGLEDDPALGQALERRADERGLPDAVLADEDHRARRQLLQRAHELVGDLGAAPLDEHGAVARRAACGA